MNIALKSLFAAGLLAAGSGLAASPAAAMPLDAALATQADTALRAENVRWVCGPYRCRWVPNYYGYGPRPYWGPRPFYGRPYYGRPWRRW